MVSAHTSENMIRGFAGDHEMIYVVKIIRDEGISNFFGCFESKNLTGKESEQSIS